MRRDELFTIRVAPHLSKQSVLVVQRYFVNQILNFSHVNVNFNYTTLVRHPRIQVSFCEVCDYHVAFQPTTACASERP